MLKVSVVHTLCSYSIPPPKSVVDPDSLNPDLDTGYGSSSSRKSVSLWRFSLHLMSSHLVILGRVIPSPPSIDMKQCRYTNFYKSHPLILNFHEKVSGYVRQQFWSFSEISWGFCGISKNKVVTQNRGITDHKIFKYKPHPNITLVYTKNYSKHDMFL